MDMCLDFHEASPYKDDHIDLDKIQHVITSLINGDDGIIILSMDGNTPVGLISGIVYEAMFSKELWATELVFWVNPEYRNYQRASALLDAYEYWAKTVKGCSRCSMTSLKDKTDTLYKRKRYSKTEINWTKVL